MAPAGGYTEELLQKLQAHLADLGSVQIDVNLIDQVDRHIISRLALGSMRSAADGSQSKSQDLS